MQQSTFFRRSAFEAVGGFNAENRSCWDGELFVSMAANGAKGRHTFASRSEHVPCASSLHYGFRPDARNLSQGFGAACSGGFEAAGTAQATGCWAITTELSDSCVIPPSYFMRCATAYKGGRSEGCGSLDDPVRLPECLSS